MICFEELLSRNGSFAYKTKGKSMEPLLRQNRDIVVIRTVSRRLKPLDVALYRRGSQYILHRVIADKGDGYLLRGDNTYTTEAVPDQDILGILTGGQRKGKAFSVSQPAYRIYSFFWTLIYPIRLAAYRGKRLAGKTARKLGWRHE